MSNSGKRTPQSWHNYFHDATRISDLAIKIVDMDNQKAFVVELKYIRDFELKTDGFVLEGYAVIEDRMDFENVSKMSDNLRCVIFFQDFYDEFFTREFKINSVKKQETGTTKHIIFTFSDIISYITSKTNKTKTIESKDFEEFVEKSFEDLIKPELMGELPELLFELPPRGNRNNIFVVIDGVRTYIDIAQNTLNDVQKRVNSTISNVKKEVLKGNLSGATSALKEGFQKSIGAIKNGIDKLVSNTKKILGSFGTIAKPTQKADNQEALLKFNLTPNKSFYEHLRYYSEKNGYLMYQTKKQIVFVKIDDLKPEVLRQYYISYTDHNKQENMPNDIIDFKRFGKNAQEIEPKKVAFALDEESKTFKILKTDAKTEGLTQNEVQITVGEVYAEQFQTDLENLRANVFKNTLKNDGVNVVVVGHINDIELFNCVNLHFAATPESNNSDYGNIKSSGYYFVTGIVDKVFNGAFFLQKLRCNRFEDPSV